MSVDKTRLDYLWQQYFDQKSTSEERRELMNIIRSVENEEIIKAKISSEFAAINSGQSDVTVPFPVDKVESVFGTATQAPNESPVIDIRSRSRKVLRWVAAAVLIAGVLTSVWLIVGRDANEGRREVATTHDVAPPRETRAVITLANGTKVYLDSVNNGTIAQESNVNVIKTADGKISYDLSANSQQLTANSLVYNTLSNPRGSKVIDMTLSDGSHVWLNAGSSVRYPVAFTGKERVVEITGEAYFEVKHNAQQPFKVHLPNGSIVEDIGTSFNINAYSDEDNMKTTLIEGSVKVVGDPALNTNNGKVLKPGQQAVINQVNPQITRIEVQTNVDLDQVMAWKNGVFNFQQQNIEKIMKELSRWYDADISYEGAKPDDLFSAIINRNNNVSQVLKMMEQTNSVHFRIEGKKITVTK